ncbi:MYND-type domain-containing protein [Mycena kentingensis (nom. inval.)]|nr:MYND-type domain-containing protein [Mycena kentingensis (nom. inval.)]
MSATIEYTVFKGNPAGDGVIEAKTTRPAPTGIEVLIRITHSGICGTDEHHKNLDIALGHEGVGIVEQVGDAVTRLKVGDLVGWGYMHRVCGKCESCLKGQDQYCVKREWYGTHNFHQGSFGSHAIWDETFIFKVPEGLAPEFAAPLMCGGATVFNAIEQHNIRPTDRVGVIGVGGLGHLAIQFLAKMGCIVVVFSGSDSKKAEAKQLGATEFYATKGVSKFEGVKPLDHLIITASFLTQWKPYLDIMKPEGTVYPITISGDDLLSRIGGVADEVKAFNALPRNKLAPSGKVPNVWHFDIRYIHLEPNPAHILFLFQPDSSFTHIEHIPAGSQPGSPESFDFFPESADEAAPELARAIMRAFTNGFAHKGQPKTPKNLLRAPWALTTEDLNLAQAVGKAFARVGVPALSNIAVSSKAVTSAALSTFLELFAMLSGKAPSSVFQFPASIAFDYQPSEPPSDSSSDSEDGELGGLNRVLEYARFMDSCQPNTKLKVDTPTPVLLRQSIETARKLVQVPIAESLKHAEAKDSALFIDCAARLYLGVGCTRDRTAARKYLLKAAFHPQATDFTRATAHAMLSRWNHEATGKQIRSRYLYASLHHACLAVKYARPIAAPGYSIPQILFAFKRMAPMMIKDNPELPKQFPEVFKALKEADDRYSRATEASQKRMKTPLRYKCALLGCGIEADHGKMLKKCAGKCDEDKKPYYCSKECQKQDWKNHKPFCAPGQPCSVFDADQGPRAAAMGGSSKHGQHSVVVNTPAGPLGFASSTLGPAMMKEVRDEFEKLAADGDQEKLRRAMEAMQSMDIETLNGPRFAHKARFPITPAYGSRVNSNILAIGASRNIGYFTTIRLLEKGATVTLLLRNPSTFDNDEVIQRFVKSGRARLVKGDATSEEDMHGAWAAAGTVDTVIFTVGTYPAGFSITKGFLQDPPNLVAQCMLNVLCTIPTTFPSPRLVAVSTTGISPVAFKALPWLMKPLYAAIHIPHQDKLAMERAMAYCADNAWGVDGNPEPSEEYIGADWRTRRGLPAPGTLKGRTLVVSAAMLTDGKSKADALEAKGGVGEQGISVEMLFKPFRLVAFLFAGAQLASALTWHSADFSSLINLENSGIRYKDNGVTTPLETILHNRGVNLARIRIWTSNSTSQYSLAYGLALAKRATAAGMQLLIDLHYSDTWADPGHQSIPAGWPTTLAGLNTQIFTYTMNLVNSFKNQGTPIAFIQIGNEINDGMLWPVGRISVNGYSPLSQMLHSAISGVRMASPSTRTMIHLANGWSGSAVASFYNQVFIAGQLATTDVDVMGFSFYPFYGTGATYSALQSSLQAMVTKFGKDVMVVETDFPQACSGVALSQNIAVGTAGQQSWVLGIRNVLSAISGGHGIGISYWEPAWIGNAGLGSSCADNLVVDSAGNTRASIAMFSADM